MSGIAVSTSEMLARLGGAMQKIDELTAQLYLTEDKQALEYRAATLTRLKQLQEAIKKQFFYLENRYLSLLDDARLRIRVKINSHSFNVIFSPDRTGDYLCNRNTLLYYKTAKPLYFYSGKFRHIPTGKLDFNISIECAGTTPVFWIFETSKTGEILKTSQKLENGESSFRIQISEQARHIYLGLRFLGKGSCRINYIRAEQALASLGETFPRVPVPVKSLKIACILDKLSAAALTPSANFLPLQKGDYEAQLKDFAPDFLLVESCWEGNGMFGAFNSRNRGETKLRPILEACRKLEIPTVFWNKEDPWHYEQFVNVANLFDHIFTTDANMIPRYRKDLGRVVHCLPFAAQPVLHYPGNVKNGKAFFAGTWYTDKPERCEDFLHLDQKLRENGIAYDIFDRCQSMGLERFAWPDKFRKKILGELTPAEVFAKSREYKFQLNVNSVKNSPTMFSRRVFESMAAGTPVIGNYAEGLGRTFPGLTMMFDKGNDDSELLRNLNEDARAYEEFREKGILAVMRDHTYERRLEEICRIIGIEAKADLPMATMIFNADSHDAACRAEAAFECQTWKNKKLLLYLRPFDKFYEFLNKNSADRRYVFSTDGESAETTGQGLEIHCDQSGVYAPEFVELQVYANPETAQ